MRYKKVYSWVPDHDFDSANAEDFGEVHQISLDKIDIHNPDKILRVLKKEFMDFNEDLDYLCLNGPLIINVLSIWLLKNKERLNLLIFDAKDRKYIVRTIVQGK